MDFRITIKKGIPWQREQIIALYEDAGWTAYLNDTDKLIRAIKNSQSVYSAYIGERLAGLARTISDGESISYIQDLLVLKEYKRLGIGTKLMAAVINENPHIRRFVLMTDIDPVADSFYKSVGFKPAKEAGCIVYIKE